MRLTKPETRKVAMQLTGDNKLGYRSSKGGPVGKGTLLEYVVEQKEKHPTKVRAAGVQWNIFQWNIFRIVVFHVIRVFEGERLLCYSVSANTIYLQ